MSALSVERGRGSGWMIWLLLVVLLALLVWWLLEGGVQTRASAGDVAVSPPVEVRSPDAAPPAGPAAAVPMAAAPGPVAPVNDLTMLTGASDPGLLAGRPVVLDGVTVRGMAGDGGFWIGAPDGPPLFAVWSGGETPAGEAGPALEPGQVVEVHGVLRRMPADVAEQLVGWNVGEADAAAVAEQAVYLDVDSVFVLGAG